MSVRVSSPFMHYSWLCYILLFEEIQLVFRSLLLDRPNSRDRLPMAGGVSFTACVEPNWFLMIADPN